MRHGVVKGLGRDSVASKKSLQELVMPKLAIL